MSASRFTVRLAVVPARFAMLLTSFLLSVMMTAVVSFVSTSRSAGFTAHLVSDWLPAWGLSWLIAFPCLLITLPLVRRLTTVLIRS